MQQLLVKLQPYIKLLNKTIIDYPLPKGFSFQFSYFQAGLTVLMLFLLILTLGQLRHRFVHWHMGGMIPGVFFGFMIAIFLEGIFIVGGKTVLTEVLGWRSAPKPLANFLDAGRNQMINVLGASDKIIQSTPADVSALENASVGDMMTFYQNMTQTDKESLQQFICK
jgi:hypothetical protein